LREARKESKNRDVEFGERQSAFYKRIRDDNRISPTHISLYFAIIDEGGPLAGIPFFLRREVIMDKAKINSRVTYNKCLRELHDYGYVDYLPSFMAGRSMVSLIALMT
jgi:hypothetical protein